MKNKTLFSSLCLLCLLWTYTSCSGDSANEPDLPAPTPEQPPTPIVDSDTVAVTFQVGGEVNISEEPLTRASSSNDLYGFNIFQGLKPIKDWNSWNGGFGLYAYGYFDNLSDISIKLAKDRYYFFEMVYIPDGKNKVYQYADGHYANPFESIFAEQPINGHLNEVMYNTRCNLSMMDCGATQGKGITDYRVQSNQFNSIERYQGTLWNLYVDKNTKNVNINLYRMMVGIRLIADDFSEGQIILSSTHGIKYSMKPSQTSTTNILDVVVELPTMPTVGFITCMDNERMGEIIVQDQPFLNEQQAGLFITYTDKEGKEIPLYSNNNFNFKRLTRHILQFSVEESVINGGISSTIKDEPNGEMADGGWTW